MSKTAKRVFFVLYDGVQLLDVAGPAEVLSQANELLGSSRYHIAYVSSSPSGKVMSSAGLELSTEPLPKLDSEIDLLIVPGAVDQPIKKALEDTQLMEWLAEGVSVAQRNASICTGAFLLGELGLLDNKSVTTHWIGTKALQDRFPSALVKKDVLYINDENLWTSAGVLSGVDMALAIVKHDLGDAMALQIARLLVVFLFRDGGQSQFSGPMDLQTRAGNSDLIQLVAWLETRLQDQLRVEDMAAYMAMSIRTLHRKCLAVLDMTPAKLLAELRLERARSLLHEKKVAIKAIAVSSGFANAAAFSKAFSQRFGIAPIKYRQRFRHDLSLKDA